VSRDALQLVRAAAESFVRGDFEAALKAFDEGVVYEVLPSTGLEPGVYRGHDAMRLAFRQWMTSWEEYETGLVEVIETGDRVIAVGWDRARAKTSGLVVERPDVAFVYEVRDNRIVRAWMHPTKGDALRAVRSHE
jgi:ketosteroid isomerase-like protein